MNPTFEQIFDRIEVWSELTALLIEIIIVKMSAIVNPIILPTYSLLRWHFTQMNFYVFEYDDHLLSKKYFTSLRRYRTPRREHQWSLQGR
jgi:hypothetical protein